MHYVAIAYALVYVLINLGPNLRNTWVDIIDRWCWSGAYWKYEIFWNPDLTGELLMFKQRLVLQVKLFKNLHNLLKSFHSLMKNM